LPLDPCVTFNCGIRDDRPNKKGSGISSAPFRFDLYSC
jgi:hypothetical protein